MSKDVVAALRTATDGLLYTSESDEPFEVVVFDNRNQPLQLPAVCHLVAKEPSCPVKQITLEEFFLPLTQEEDWHGDTEKEDVRRYQELRKVIEKHLADPQVYRIGETQVDLLVIGRNKDKDWIGVRTKAIET